MKAIVILLLVLAISIGTNAQTSSKVIRLDHFARGGNYNVTLLIGSDSNSIMRIAHECKEYLPDPFFEMYLLQSESVEFISEYISNRCIPINNMTPRTETGYTIKVISNEEKMNCYIMGKGASIAYFNGLTKWIEESQYKNSCEEIIQRIEPWIR